MLKVLIIGSDGMLGRDLVTKFSNNSFYKVLPYNWRQLDITDAAAVKKIIRAKKPNYVINAAAFTAVDTAEFDRDRAIAVNATGVTNIALAAKDVGAIMVHYSTDYVFLGDKPQGYREDDIPGPAINVYGESKLLGEQALQEISPSYYLIRTAWLYGFHGKNFVKTMLDLAKENEELSVVDDQYGSPTYTKDVAEATSSLLEDQYSYGVYHAVNSGEATWYALAKQIFQCVGIKIALKPVASANYPLPAARPKYSRLINTRGPRLRFWQDALYDYLNEYVPEARRAHK